MDHFIKYWLADRKGCGQFLTLTDLTSTWWRTIRSPVMRRKVQWPMTNSHWLWLVTVLEPYFFLLPRNVIIQLLVSSDKFPRWAEPLVLPIHQVLAGQAVVSFQAWQITSVLMDNSISCQKMGRQYISQEDSFASAVKSKEQRAKSKAQRAKA